MLLASALPRFGRRRHQKLLRHSPSPSDAAERREGKAAKPAGEGGGGGGGEGLRRRGRLPISPATCFRGNERPSEGCFLATNFRQQDPFLPNLTASGGAFSYANRAFSTLFFFFFFGSSFPFGRLFLLRRKKTLRFAGRAQTFVNKLKLDPPSRELRGFPVSTPFHGNISLYGEMPVLYALFSLFFSPHFAAQNGRELRHAESMAQRGAQRQTGGNEIKDPESLTTPISLRCRSCSSGRRRRPPRSGAVASSTRWSRAANTRWWCRAEIAGAGAKTRSPSSSPREPPVSVSSSASSSSHEMRASSSQPGQGVSFMAGGSFNLVLAE